MSNNESGDINRFRKPEKKSNSTTLFIVGSILVVISLGGFIGGYYSIFDVLERRGYELNVYVGFLGFLLSAGITSCLFQALVNRSNDERDKNEIKWQANVLPERAKSGDATTANTALSELQAQGWLSKYQISDEDEGLYAILVQVFRFFRKPTPRIESLLQGETLVGANWNGARLYQADLRDCKLNEAILTRVSLLRADLSNSYLNKTILRQAQLECCCLVRSNLTNADLRSAKLKGCDFKEANLQAAKFINAKFSSCILANSDRNVQGTKVIDCNFTGANLTKANMTGATLENCHFEGTILQETIFDGATLTNIHFSKETDFNETYFRGATLKDINLDYTNMDRAYFEGATLENIDARRNSRFFSANFVNATLNKVDMYSANLQSANFHGATFINCTLNHADMTRAQLQNTNMSGIRLKEAILEDAILEGVNLTSAKLMGANCQNSDMRGAKLMKANLNGANLSGANLAGADLTGATLYGVVISDERIQFDEATTLPNGRKWLPDDHKKWTAEHGIRLFLVDVANMGVSFNSANSVYNIIEEEEE